MSPREAVQLTGYLQAHFPSQPINEYTPDALGELLADYPAADCRQAVLNLANRATRDGSGRAFCSPSDVAAEVRRIRDKRIADHPRPLPPPNLADDPAAANRWMAEQIRRIGDGEVIDCDAAYGELKARNLAELRVLMPKPEMGEAS